MRASLLLPLLLSVVAVPGRSSIMTLAGYCWESDGNPNLTELIANDCTINNGTTSATNSTSNSPTGFSSTESATASSNTWHLAADATLSNYPSSLFVYSEVPNGSGGTIPFVTDLGLGSATLTDGITVSGGTGNYSINFIFSLDGAITTSDPAFGSAFSADISLAQGTPTLPQVLYCQASYCDGRTILSTFTLTYSNLTYGVLTDVSLAFSASAYVNPGVSSGLLNGSASAEFADTVQLTQVLITDANGNPVPGITLTSEDGYSYPLAGANTVPEPSMLLPLALGAAVVVLFKRSAKPLIRS
jgi:hypothetical protein